LLSGIKEEDGIIWTLFPQSGHGSVEFIWYQCHCSGHVGGDRLFVVCLYLNFVSI
jgi:hypothetical protein